MCGPIRGQYSLSPAATSRWNSGMVDRSSTGLASTDLQPIRGEYRGHVTRGVL